MSMIITATIEIDRSTPTDNGPIDWSEEIVVEGEYELPEPATYDYPGYDGSVTYLTAYDSLRREILLDDADEARALAALINAAENLELPEPPDDDDCDGEPELAHDDCGGWDDD